MKKFIAIFLMMLLVLSSTASSENLDIQVIGDDSAEMMPVTLDDIQLDTMIEIPGYAELTPIWWDIADCFFQRKKGVLGKINVYSSSGRDYNEGIDHTIECDKHSTDEYKFYSEDWLIHNESKTQTDFSILLMDITNITNEAIDFGKNIAVKVVFDNNVEYQGWYRQRDYDLNVCTILDPEDNFPIDPSYTGHYVFGCTLPTAVINGSEPLRMVIELGDSELTYNVRK